MNSLFTCPVCGQRLSRNGAVYRCAAGHCFDVAAAGYTYLLPSGGKHAKLPGDSKKDARMREMFLLNLRWFMATLLEGSVANGYGGAAA